MTTFLIAALSIVLSVMAQFALKAGMSGLRQGQATTEATGLSRLVIDLLLNKYLVLGFALYGLGAIVWLVVLSKWDVSKAYPLVGMGFVLTVLIGVIIGEQVTPLRLLGVTLIAAGILCVGAS